jgi:hypothetical protein
MTPQELKVWELTDEILEIVYHQDDFTTSDLQGAVQAVITKAILYKTEEVS